MTKVLEKPTPLRRIRDAMSGGKGMTAQEVADKVAEVLGKDKMTSQSIINYEKLGVSKIKVLRALAIVYDRTLEEIESAADKKQW